MSSIAISNKRRKANAILEYSVLMFIIVGFLVSIHYMVKRNVQARLKAESDHYLRHGQGLEWGSDITFSRSETDYERKEEAGGDVVIQSEVESNYLKLAAPPPSVPGKVPLIGGSSVMDHKQSVMHVQDVAGAPPLPQYPDLEYKDWQDQGGEWHVAN